MKEFFTYVVAFGFAVLLAAIPISIYGYIFSDDSYMDVLKTSVMLATGLVTFGIFFIFLIFFFTARR